MVSKNFYRTYPFLGPHPNLENESCLLYNLIVADRLHVIAFETRRLFLPDVQIDAAIRATLDSLWRQ